MNDHFGFKLSLGDIVAYQRNGSFRSGKIMGFAFNCEDGLYSYVEEGDHFGSKELVEATPITNEPHEGQEWVAVSADFTQFPASDPKHMDNYHHTNVVKKVIDPEALKFIEFTAGVEHEHT